MPPIHHRIRVQVFDEFRVLCSESKLERTADQTLHATSEARARTDSSGLRLDIVVADDETVRRLNSEYRGLDQTTDVLAFSFEHEGEYMGDDFPPTPPDGFDFILPPREEAWLGEVIISYPQAVRQARQSGRDEGRELTALRSRAGGTLRSSSVPGRRSRGGPGSMPGPMDCFPILPYMGSMGT